jgi:hypothetical protein
VIGVVLLVAVIVRHPLPVGRLLRVPTATRLDGTLGVLVGGFLVPHGLLHLALALTLSTASYLVISRIVNWGSLAIGLLCLLAYLRRVRANRS